MELRTMCHVPCQFRRTCSVLQALKLCTSNLYRPATHKLKPRKSRYTHATQSYPLRIDQIIRLPSHLPLLILLPIQRGLPVSLPLTIIPRILIRLPALALPRALIKLIEDFLRDTIEEFFGVDA